MWRRRLRVSVHDVSILIRLIEQPLPCESWHPQELWVQDSDMGSNISVTTWISTQYPTSSLWAIRNASWVTLFQAPKEQFSQLPQNPDRWFVRRKQMIDIQARILETRPKKNNANQHADMHSNVFFLTTASTHKSISAPSGSNLWATFWRLPIWPTWRCLLLNFCCTIYSF